MSKYPSELLEALDSTRGNIEFEIYIEKNIRKAKKKLIKMGYWETVRDDPALLSLLYSYCSPGGSGASPLF